MTLRHYLLAVIFIRKGVYLGQWSTGELLYGLNYVVGNEIVTAFVYLSVTVMKYKFHKIDKIYALIKIADIQLVLKLNFEKFNKCLYII